MIRRTGLQGALRPRSFLLALIGLAAVSACPVGPFAAPPRAPAEATATSSAQTVLIDYLYPEAFLDPTWIPIDLPSSRVSLANLRVITANRRWSLEICGSASDPTSCVNALAGWDPRNAGWRGDFRSATWSQTYQDLDATKKLHLRVTPLGGDWMIFRIQLEVTPRP